MVTLAVCLETVFTDLPLAERMAGIAESGFSTVEFWHPEGTWDGLAVNPEAAKAPDALRTAAAQHGLVINDFAFHAWDGSIGGSPVKSAEQAIYLDHVSAMIEFARVVGIRRGITLSGTVDPALSRSQMRDNLEAALAAAVQLAEDAGITLLLEPLNTTVDHPGYYLDSSSEAVEIVRAIASPHLKLLYDIYHMQIMEGNVIATIEQYADCIGHFHAAGVPGRGELFDCELDYRTIFRRIEASGYQGGFGLEYFPRMEDHTQSLKRQLEYLKG